MKPKNLNDGNDNESGKKHKGKETRADAIIFSRNIYMLCVYFPRRLLTFCFNLIFAQEICMYISQINCKMHLAAQRKCARTMSQKTATANAAYTQWHARATFNRNSSAPLAAINALVISSYNH